MDSGFSKARITRYSAVSALALAVLTVSAVPIYGQNQDEPESLLPPGFSTPAPSPSPSAAPTGPAPAPTPSPPPPPSENAQPPVAPPPVEPPGAVQPSAPVQQTEIGPESSSANSQADATDVLEDELVAQEIAPSSLPARAQRTLGQVGLIGAAQGGFPADAMANVNGGYATALVAGIKKPIVSRWGHILLRRLLASDLQSPRAADDTAWVAARTRLLLNMGEGALARHLAQQVDASRYQGALYDAARDAALASADLTAFCPISSAGAAQSDDKKWQLVLAICAGMSGNQSSADAQIDRASTNQIAAEIDLQLTEKVIGAGINSRRAVSVDWEGVNQLTLWRFGLATATGIEPPASLYQAADRRFQAWRAENPAVSLGARLQSAETAAAMGVLSSSAIVDLYSMAFEDPATPAAARQSGVALREAYRQRDPADRLAALRRLWNASEDDLKRYGAQVLTARAAARFPIMSNYVESADDLVAAMFAAGLDRNAARWASLMPVGTLGWGLVTIGQPNTGEQTVEASLRSFADNDASENYRKTAFLIAGLAGLERTSDAIAEELAEEYDFALRTESRWQKALNEAAAADNPALVVLLAGVGMQAESWGTMSPAHLYHIVSALRQVGLEGEARMIAAEAVTRA